MPFSVTDVDAIFTAAIELSSPDERAEYIQRVCGESAELRERVDELLAAHFAAGDFLEPPNATVLYRDDDVQAGPGTVIGPYKLLQQIGEGGMGVVFMAEQTEPIQRTVALKVIKPGMDTRQVIARFEAERQALAMMDHPSIARVIDAGATENGRPYFVMELVKGIPITKYCDEKQLTLRERLELIKPVCEAVQHAHQKGIIHRDLKPTNVLVAEYDNRAVPKVIDFGVAKATAQKLTERTMFTEFGQVIGTVEYMSPEQAKFNQLDVDTRSDIYSLGVLLYELLTGSTPFERERLREAAFDEVLRIIREEEPPRPSTRLSTSETLPSIAANRHTEPARLSRDVSGELDWIVMKCLEKDRNRRYETANGLVRDIERYLHDEPVQACPPSAAYRFRKFARRNKVALAVASAAVAMLLLGVVGLAISNRLIAAQRAQAETERQRAEENFLRARLAVKDILFDAARGLDEWSSLSPSLREKFTDKTVNFYRSILQEESTEPSLQYETAVGYRSLAMLQDSMKDFPQAEKFCRQSIEILDRLAFDYPDAVEYRHQLAYSHFVLAGALRQDKRAAEAEAAVQRAAVLYEELFAQRPNVADYYIELPLCYRVLAQLQKSRGATLEVEQTVRKLLDLSSKVPSGSEKAEVSQLNIALALGDVGWSQEAMELYKKVVLFKPNDSKAYYDLGFALHQLGEIEQAAGAYRKAIELEPINARAYRALGIVLSIQGKLEEAVAAYRKSIEINPNSAGAFCCLGSALMQQGRIDEAVQTHRKAIELAPDAPEAYLNLGEALSKQGKFEEAVAAYRKTIELKPRSNAYNRLGFTLQHQGKYDEADAAFHTAIELAPDDAAPLNELAWHLAATPKAEHRDAPQAVELATKATELAPQDGYIWNTLGVAQYRASGWQKSIASLEKAVALREGGDASDWFFLAMAHWQLGHKDEAGPWYDKAVEWMEQNQSKNEELLRFRAEATELLGVTEPKTHSKSAPPTGESAKAEDSTTASSPTADN